MNMSGLAQSFVARAESQEMKGKARDRAALEFFLGAAAISVGKLQEQILFNASMIAVRGFSWVKELAGKQPAKAA
jgi:hypothetical protein